MRVAVLDLGTNVFNMLLAEFTRQECKYIKVDKCASRLGGGGLSKGYISQEAFKTGSDAMEYLLKSIEESGGADVILPYATSAIRDASNGVEFAQYLNNKFNIKVNIISGSKEAEYIFNGIMESVGYLLDENGKFHRIGVPKGELKTSVGSGDSMVAGFIAGYQKTGDYATALRTGAACGSASAFSATLATREEVEAMYHELELMEVK